MCPRNADLCPSSVGSAWRKRTVSSALVTANAADLWKPGVVGEMLQDSGPPVRPREFPCRPKRGDVSRRGGAPSVRRSTASRGSAVPAEKVRPVENSGMPCREVIHEAPSPVWKRVPVTFTKSAEKIQRN